MVNKQIIKGKSITAVDSADKSKSSYIGSILLFAVGSCEVPIEAVNDWIVDQKVLQRSDLPKPPEPFDAFQCACSEENVHIWDALDQDKVMSFESDYKGKRVTSMCLTLPAARNSNVYILERRLWLQDKKEAVAPQHPNVARLLFDESGKIFIEMFPEFSDKQLEDRISEIINKEFQRQKTFINGTRHRQAIYKMLEAVDSVKFLGGNSTYFVPLQGMERIESFSNYMNEVVSKYRTTAYPCEMRTIEVVDTEQRRKEIARDVAREVEVAYNKLLDDAMKFVTKNDKMSDESKEKLLERRLEAMGKNKALLERYEAFIGTKITISKKPLENVNMSGRVKDLLMQLQDVIS